MTRIVLPFTLLTVAFAVSLPAQAASLTRTFVSAAGSDSNPCTISQPCATFAHAYTTTAANGIIAALDPGKYGPLTITGPVTINGNGWAAVTAPAAGNGFTITAGASDNVALIGLEIDGAGAAYDGINFQSGGSLTVTNCVVQNFVQNGGGDPITGDGILVQPTSGTIDLAITNTTSSHNGYVGIYYLPPSGSPSANIFIDHVVTSADTYGIAINSVNTSGGATVGTISNAIASNNNSTGIFANDGTGTFKLSIDNVSVSANSVGIIALSAARILLGRSVIAGNTTGIDNATSPTNTLYTYQNNQIDQNGVDISSAMNPLIVR